jgi:hypothetical protein
MARAQSVAPRVTTDSYEEDKAMTFQPGQSGNPAGRPPGSRNKRARVVHQALEERAREIIDKTIDTAVEGNTSALAMCLDRLAAKPKSDPVDFRLPALETTADAIGAMRAIAAAVSDGDITTGEAKELAGVVSDYVNALGMHEFEERIARLERADVATREELDRARTRESNDTPQGSGT